MQKHIYTALLAIVVSYIFAVGTIRFCVATERGTWLSPGKLICGVNLGSMHAGFKRISIEEVSITSNIPESQEFSIAKGLEASKLMDGNTQTLAAPGSPTIDYAINFLQDHEIKQVVIVWKDYGINENYIKEWSVESLQKNRGWEVVAAGDARPKGETIINERFISSGLRIRATSQEDWIGVYEVTIIGRPL